MMVFRRLRSTPPSDPDLSYCKLCDIDDFASRALVPFIDSVYAGSRNAAFPDFPRGLEERKQWEIAMALRTLQDFGALRADSEILGVGAGNEATIFWLTNHVQRVFATDLYLTPGEWAIEAPPAMLSDPQPPIPLSWDPRKLVVQHMNALDLRYADESFDGIFSSSSIEHFGTRADVRKSVEEMVRVLRPGGVLTVATEYRLAGPAPGLPGTLLFSKAQLIELFAGLPLTPVSPWSLRLSRNSSRVVVDFKEATDDIVAKRPRFSTYPHIVLKDGRHRWTSVHLGFKKSPALATRRERRL